MKNIKKNIHLDIAPLEAYRRFILDVDSWWPKDYTWYKDPNATMHIDLSDKRCIERNTDGEELQWGVLLQAESGQEIEMLWMIDPQREHISEPADCSRVRITFSEDEQGETDMEITHSDFDNLDEGEALDSYHALLDSDDGWLFLMRNFKSYCQRHRTPYAELS